jgi:hypothetical protein
MTTIYDDLPSSTGLSNIEFFYANQTAAPVEGKALLASILFANNDNNRRIGPHGDNIDSCSWYRG